MMHRILILDDEPNILSALKRTLLNRGAPDASTDYVVETFSEAEPALARLNEASFDAILSDYRMPGMNGVDFLKQVRIVQPDAIRIILSGYADLDALISAINEAEIFRFITKPWVDYELKLLLKEALKTRELQIENQKLADMIRVKKGIISRQEAELRRLEKVSPGITKVKWREDGAVLFEDMTPEEVEEVNRLLYSPPQA